MKHEFLFFGDFKVAREKKNSENMWKMKSRGKTKEKPMGKVGRKTSEYRVKRGGWKKQEKSLGK